MEFYHSSSVRISDKKGTFTPLNGRICYFISSFACTRKFPQIIAFRVIFKHFEYFHLKNWDYYCYFWNHIANFIKFCFSYSLLWAVLGDITELPNALTLWHRQTWVKRNKIFEFTTNHCPLNPAARFYHALPKLM